MIKTSQEFRFAVKVLLAALGLFVISVVITAVHEHIWKSHILYYDFIKITAGCAVLGAVIMIVLRMLSRRCRRLFDFKTIVLSSTIFCLLSYSFNMTFPILLDRSFSVYMLGTLYKFDSPLPLSELEAIVSKYFHERSLVNKRIHEQLATGSIVIDNGRVELTGRGRSIVEMHIMIGRIFNLDMNNIAPE